MKRSFSILIILSMLAFVLSGCSSTTSATSIKANWYTENSQENIVYINENLVYNVVYNAATDKNTTLDVEDFSGTYEMNFSSSSDFENYILTTKLTTSGKYVNSVTSSETPFCNDTVETETTFKSVKNKLKPIKSNKKYNGHSPLNSGEIELYQYEYDTVYEGSTATTTLISHSDNITNQSETKTFAKIDKTYTYFDNDQLFFAIRSLDLGESTSVSISSVIPIDEELKTISVKVTDDEPYVSFNLKDLGVKENNVVLTDDKNVRTIKTYIGLNATMTGATTTCYYAVKGDNYADYKARLIKMESPLPYDLGKMVYTISSVDYSELQP